MSERMIAIRCSSEVNRWMDSVMIVPVERAAEIAQVLQRRFAGIWELEGESYGDTMREVAYENGIEAIALCDYDEDTDEPTADWEAYCDRVYRRMQVIEIDI